MSSCLGKKEGRLFRIAKMPSRAKMPFLEQAAFGHLHAVARNLGTSYGVCAHNIQDQPPTIGPPTSANGGVKRREVSVYFDNDQKSAAPLDALG